MGNTIKKWEYFQQPVFSPAETRGTQSGKWGGSIHKLFIFNDMLLYARLLDDKVRHNIKRAASPVFPPKTILQVA